jgi:chromosome segregation ATPase
VIRADNVSDEIQETKEFVDGQAVPPTVQENPAPLQETGSDAPPAKPPSKYRHAWSVLWLGLRTSFAAAITAVRGPSQVDSECYSPAEMLRVAQQRTLESSLAAARADVERLRAELRSSSQLVSDRDREIRELKSTAQSDAETAAASGQRLREAIENAEETIRLKDSEIARMASEIAQLTENSREREAALLDKQSQLADAIAETTRARADALAEREAALNAAHAEAARVSTDLRDQLQQVRQAAAEVAEKNARSEARIVELQQQMQALAEAAGRLTSTQKELAEKTEEADLLRQDLLGQRRRVVQVESEVAGSRAAVQAQDSAQRELQRKTTQLEVLNEELAKFRMRAEKLEIILREFYLQAIDPVTVAAASAELAAASQHLSPSDHDNIAAVQDKLDKFLAMMKRLVADMEQVGITTGPRS